MHYKSFHLKQYQHPVKRVGLTIRSKTSWNADRNADNVTYKTKKTRKVDSEILLLAFLKLGFTLGKAQKPLQGMELQEKEAQKAKSL